MMLTKYFEKFTASLPLPAFMVSQDGVIVDINPTGSRELGLNRQKLLGTDLVDLVEDSPGKIEKFLSSCLTNDSAEEFLYFKDGQGKALAVNCFGFCLEEEEENKSFVILHCQPKDNNKEEGNFVSRKKSDFPEENLVSADFTRQFALNNAISELSQQLIGADEDLAEMAELVLTKARELTGSRRGFVSMVDNESGGNIVYSPIINTGGNFDISGEKLENIISVGDEGNYLGLWGQALDTGISFYNNKVVSQGAKKEFLGGALLEKMLAVPVKYGGKIVGLIALANSWRDYRDIDLFFVERLADLYALAINRYHARGKRRELEGRLAQAQKMESIGTLAGGIAHDFNNILGVILGYADMARTEVPEDSRIAGDLDHIIKAGYRARDLVRQILTFSRQKGTTLIPLQAASVIKEAVKMLCSSLPANIRIYQDIDSKCSKIMADPTQIHQILLNLCTNAYHAMEETGGDLYVTLKDSKYTGGYFPEELGVREGPLVELVVRDTGHGISENLKERIFDPYFTTKEQGKGSGMGLSVIHGIVKEYGGGIIVESEAGKGSSFHIFIPAISGEEKSAAESRHSPIPRGREHVLFVDDEVFLLDMATDMLRSLGYSVSSRRSGFEALELFKERPNQFDIVLTDQVMPGMTGSELAGKLLEIRPELPIIICSGYNNKLTEKDVENSGIKDYISKPFGKRELATCLRRVLDKCL